MGSKITESRWFYIAVSVLLAFILWVYVGKEANPMVNETITGVPVEFSGMEKLEERGLMISEGAEQTVSIYIRARRNEVTKILQGETKVTVDVSGITAPGEMDYSVQGQKITYPRSVSSDAVQIRYTRPERIEFTVSRWASKEVEVKGVFNGGVADGYLMGDFSLVPQTVTVSGPQELVEQIDYAQVSVSQTDLDATYTNDTPYTFIGFDGEEVAAEGLERDPETVLVTLPVFKLKEVPLTVDLIPGGGVTDPESQVDVTIEPASIMVSGDETALEGLEEISLGSVELYKIFGTESFTKTIQLSPELTNVSGISEATVTVKVKGLTTKVLEANNIGIINKPSGVTADVVSKTLSVQIRGTEEAVEAVTPSQLRVVADLSGITEATGNRTVPAKVYLDSGSDVGVVGDYNVVVSVTR